MSVRSTQHKRTYPRVLLAEPNRISQRLFVRMLARLGYEVCLADDCEEALRIYQHRAAEFSLVILDLKAPFDGGIDLLRRWPRDANARHVPLIALGDDPAARAREACLDAGADLYLAEALRDERLTHAVMSLAGLPGGAGASVRDGAAAGPVLAGPLDEKIFRSLLDLSPEPSFIRELMDDFHREGTGHFTRLQEALRERDVTGWREALHGLRGSAVGLGAALLAQLCGRLEAFSEDAIRAGEGYSEYAYLLEVFNSTADAMQAMILERFQLTEPDQGARGSGV
ncbi:response regulator [Thioalkalivibrio thiocyanodenitrificans]|uniref:response regulator n=1 Tax=Thioalkalivibrio thiocyanodenitrificans TaxID=243063 RepID=UPI00036308BA|nr:response regulator [Thioalkalivibrio thiocyanodenitrificans]